MAASIIRDRIANMSIRALLQDRNEIKEGAMKSAQETLSGWGIHVETIEIEDVQITNNTLFKHM